MRVAVWNEFWSTLGGGEKYAGSIAEALRPHHDVELLGPDPIDVALLEERLLLVLAGVNTRQISAEADDVSACSAGYDLFVNASYASAVENRAPHGLLVVYFPTEPEGALTGWRRRTASTAARLGVRAPESPVRWASGFRHPERERWYQHRWSDGNGRLMVSANRPTTLRVQVPGSWPAVLGPRKVTVEVDGVEVVTATIAPGERRRLEVGLAGRTDGAAHEVLIRSDTFVVAEVTASDDPRTLGVPVVVLPPRRTPRAVLLGRFPWVVRRPVDFTKVAATYDRVVSISEYTSGFVRRYWGIEPELLHPPVTMISPGTKEPLILSVGRFFGADSGHSKKQVEMVQAFRSLVAGGLRGWQLHLVGGCADADRPYLDEVRRQAAGLEVTLHVGASGAEVTDLYRRASILWSATGLGHDPRTEPVQFEHFGITIVEAMSAGAVPVAVGVAGPAEIITHLEHGLLFFDRRGLVERTRQLVDEPDLLQRLATAARQRSEDFSTAQFGRRLEALVGRVCAGAGDQPGGSASTR